MLYTQEDNIINIYLGAPRAAGSIDRTREELVQLSLAILYSPNSGMSRSEP